MQDRKRKDQKKTIVGKCRTGKWIGTNLGSSQKVENAGPENGGPENGGTEIAGPSTCVENAGIMLVISDRNSRVDIRQNRVEPPKNC